MRYGKLKNNSCQRKIIAAKQKTAEKKIEHEKFRYFCFAAIESKFVGNGNAHKFSCFVFVHFSSSNQMSEKFLFLHKRIE